MNGSPAPIDGTVDPAFAGVRDAFVSNFAAGLELGAWLAVSIDGRNVDYAGGSMITDYLGTKLALAGTEAEVLTARLSLDKLRRYREKFPAWKDADPFMLLDTNH